MHRARLLDSEAVYEKLCRLLQRQSRWLRVAEVREYKGNLQVLGSTALAAGFQARLVKHSRHDRRARAHGPRQESS